MTDKLLFTFRITDRSWWLRIRAKALSTGNNGISMQKLMFMLLDAWLEDRITIKEG